MRERSRWALHLSRNREKNLFTGLVFGVLLVLFQFLFIHSFILSLTGHYLLSTYYTAGIVLGSEDTAMNKLIKKIPTKIRRYV